MKKTHLKTFLFIEDNTVANETILYASLMNAGIKPNEFGIAGLLIFATTLKELGREDSTQVERVGENKLHIDAKINGKWENVAIIEAVEIWEVLKPNEDDEEIVNILSGTQN